MRVLQVHTTYRDAGGEDVAVQTEAETLRNAGHEVVQAQTANPTDPLGSLLALGTAPWRPAAARAVRHVVADVAPDVVSVHNTWFALSPAVVAALATTGVPVVMTLHNYRLMCPAGSLFHHGRQCTDCVGTNPWHAVRHRCYRGSAALSAVAAATVETWHRKGAIDAVSRFVVMTDAGKDLFVRGGLPGDRMRVLPHGLADPGGMLARPSGSRSLVFVGRAVEEKGLPWLLDWWGSRAREMTLEIVGGGPVLDDLPKGVLPGVVLHGALPRSQALDIMRTARAVVIPSVWPEPFGLVAVEAMACGVGVASTGTGGLADIHGPDAGWTAPVGDHAAWDRLLEGLTDSVVDHAGVCARQRYLTRFTDVVAARGMLALFEEVAGG